MNFVGSLTFSRQVEEVADDGVRALLQVFRNGVTANDDEADVRVGTKQVGDEARFATRVAGQEIAGVQGRDLGFGHRGSSGTWF